MIGFGEDGVRFKEFSRGRQLRVAAANEVFTIDLTDTAKLLPALLGCVTQQINPAPVMASTATAAAAPSAHGSDFKAEATVIAANLLSQAGISGFRIAAPNEFPELKSRCGRGRPQRDGHHQCDADGRSRTSTISGRW